MGALVDLVAPPRCAACAERCESRRALCRGCEEALRRAARGIWFAAPGLDLAWAAAPYEGMAHRLVAALKFGGRLALAGVAARAMAAAAPRELLSGELVPVPPDPRRLRRRGFDPADRIAVALGRERGLPCRDALRRGHSPRQVGRGRAARLAEPPRVWIAGAAPARAVLVDDVVTTGATLAACAAALRAGGAAEVLAVTFARA